jgi:hypothetical protein
MLNKHPYCKQFHWLGKIIAINLKKRTEIMHLIWSKKFAIVDNLQQEKKWQIDQKITNICIKMNDIKYGKPNGAEYSILCMCVSSQNVWLISKWRKKTRLLHHLIIIINMRPLFRAVSSSCLIFLWLCFVVPISHTHEVSLCHFFFCFFLTLTFWLSVLSWCPFWAFISFFFCWLVFYISALRRRMAATRP